MKLRRPSALALVLAVLVPFAPVGAQMTKQTTKLKIAVDGRPLDARANAAYRRNGIVYADIVDLTRAFSGLLVFTGKNAVRVDIGGNVGTFRAGSTAATLKGTATTLSGAPFVASGDLFVPVAAFATLANARVVTTTTSVNVQSGAPPLSMSEPTGPSSPSPALALAMVPSAAAAADGLHLTLSVTNKTSAPYTLNFASGARVRFVVLKDGTSAWDSTQGRVYTQSLGSTTLAPGETKSYTAVWPDFAKAGAGRYTLQTTLLTTPPLQTSTISLGASTPSPSST